MNMNNFCLEIEALKVLLASLYACYAKAIFAAHLKILFCVFTINLWFVWYRYLRPLVADVAVVAKCHLSALYRHEKGKLFAQLVDLLQFYERFEINDHVGTQLTDDEVLQSHYDRFQAFQLLAFKKIPKVCFTTFLCKRIHHFAAFKQFFL